METALEEFVFVTFKRLGVTGIKGNLPWLGWKCTKRKNVSVIFSSQPQVLLVLGLSILLYLLHYSGYCQVSRCPEQSQDNYSPNKCPQLVIYFS